MALKKRRIRIGCILNCPENIYQRRIIDGLMSRCIAYDYDLVFFSPLVTSAHFYKDYLHAEANLLNLINFEHLDAVVVVSLPLIAMSETYIYDVVRDILRKHCSKPVICLDLPIDDYETVYTDDTNSFAEITRHVLDEHNCKKVYFLAGSQIEGMEDQRIKGFLGECERHGMKIDESQIFIGDFWYTSGAQLADRIISGELEKPDAVICASDHMAIGLVNRLDQNGIRVPEDIIVTGHDATQEALMNEISITTYVPNNKAMAEEAIDRIRIKLEPGKPLALEQQGEDEGLIVGLSCGCKVDYKHLIRALKPSLYKVNRDYQSNDINNCDDFYSLMESYMLEALTESKNPDECLGNIASQVYLIEPYDNFYLCMRRDWLDTDNPLVDGFPDYMRVNLVAVPHSRQNDPGARYFHCNDDREMFKTELMLPEMHYHYDKPQCYFFFPVHFQNNTLGYIVVQCNTDRMEKPTHVTRNWIRNVNNALEMARVNEHLVEFSEIDKLTGLKNRRGMDNALAEMMESAGKSDSCYAIVIDLDGLKQINDNYGHTEGDYAITSVASVVAQIADSSEIAVRAGGDEFYIIGIGDGVTEKTLISRVSKYRKLLDKLNNSSNKPYKVSASVGFSIRKYTSAEDICTVINSADKHMYICKAESKRARR